MSSGKNSPESELIRMNDSTIMKEAEGNPTFREIFYEDEFEIQTVERPVKNPQQGKRYKEAQEKITKLHQDKTIASNLNKYEKIGAMSLKVTAVSGIVGGVGGLLGVNFLLFVGIAFMSVAIMSFVFCADKYELTYKSNEREEALLLRQYCSDLVHSSFKGRILSDISDLNENWQKIEVLEDGEIVFYMLRIIVDKDGLENVESLKVVQQ